MKTKVFKLFVLLMALLPSFSQSNASVTSNEEDDIMPITLIKSTGPTRPPRSIVPECYCQNGTIYIICDSGISSITATVMRYSDETEWSDSSLGNTLRMAVSSNAGTYRLVLTLSDGSTWYGEYTL